MRTPLLLILLALLSGFCGSCRSASNGHLHLQARAADDVIAPGDTVSVVDTLRPETVMASARINRDGKMEFPGLGMIQVTGMSRFELHEQLRELYAPVYGNTKLNVDIVQPNARFYVYGEVTRPGRYKLTRGLTALEGTMNAGPDESYADLRVVRLIRGGSEISKTTKLNIRKMARGNLSFNVALQDGDILYVPPTPVGSVFSPIMSSKRNQTEEASAPKRLDANPR
ncbi:MAG: polysaccharide biosynthesis/export family protein [Planctomycetes bacterium]|nr:polysaccharide biosynthesis/export family protein [Planctomycetota bacterium]